jgi:NADH-quinone oxidoreductase subunit L
MTHAFFKALMFLGSGSVIHAMHHEQDIRKMGALRAVMPITHATFFIGWLAIIGMPPFAGFFSKDEILWYSFSSPLGHWSLWLVGVVAALCTAFYMTRLMALTFWGESRVDHDHAHPHESPAVMTVPLIALAFLSAVGGLIGIPHVLGELLPGHPPNVLMDWLKPVVMKPAATGPEISHTVELGLMGVSVALAGLSALFAYHAYVRRPELPKIFTARFPKTHALVEGKYFVDEFYFSRIIKPLIEASQALWAYVDVNFIDRTTYFVGDVVKGAGSTMRTLQTGNLQQYALYIALGMIVMLMFLVKG